MSEKTDRAIDRAFRLTMAAVILAIALALAAYVWAKTRGL